MTHHTLLLLRHGIAEERRDGLDDGERALTPRGRSRTRAVLDRLVERGLGADRLISSPLVRAAYHAYFHRVLPLVGRLVSGHASAYSYLPVSVAHFPTEEALAARLRDAGFREVTWRRLTLGVAALHTAVA